jgi:iron complex transport system ATP-binding protein
VTLAAHEISYRVGEAEILQRVDLEFTPRELVAVVGPNGAGKTTLLQILGGEIVPTTGEVTIDGEALGDMPVLELARHRAMLTQDGPVDIPFPVAGVVALGRAPHRRTEGNSAGADAAVVAKTMEDVGIGNLAARMFGTLSGGERSLASLARVLAQWSPVLLLDEPTVALDVAIEERTMAMIRDRSRADQIVVAVIHDLNLAAKYADRTVLLSRGTVVADGTPGEVLTSDLLTEVYRHPMEVVPHPLREGPLILVG